MVVWFLLASPQVDGLMILVQALLRSLGGERFGVSFDGFPDPAFWLGFHELREKAPDLRLGADPLQFTRGLPLYLALILALPDLKQHLFSRFLGGIGVSIAALLGFSFLMLFRVDVALRAAGGGEILPEGFLAIESQIGGVEVALKIVVTRLLPVGLWFWMARSFLLAAFRRKDLSLRDDGPGS